MQLATLCYVKRNNKTLMIHRVKKQNDMHEGKWNGLGGKFMPGESPEQCVIREVKEECGLKIENPELKGFLTFPKFSNDIDWYVFVYEAHEFSGDIIESDEGNLKWIDDRQLVKLNLWEGDPHFFKWMEENKFFSAKFYYENGKLKDFNVIFHEI
jgi:8-oxo-dGTP diphosphatase